MRKTEGRQSSPEIKRENLTVRWGTFAASDRRVGEIKRAKKTGGRIE